MDDPQPSFSSSSNKPSGEVFDFTSSTFQPSLALRHKDEALKYLPCPNAKTFNNLDEYAKTTFSKNQQRMIQLPDSKPERKFTEEQKASCVKSRGVSKQMSNVLTKMDKVESPLQLLKQAKGLRIKILVRRKKGGPKDSQFSWLSALLVAFDKHLNLVLHDVDETISQYRNPTNCDPSQLRHKHTNRMFLRGDNVVIVSFI